MSNFHKLREGIAQIGWRFLVRAICWRFPDWILRYENAYLVSTDNLTITAVTPKDISFRLATPQDSEDFGALQISSKVVRQRLALGDRCAIAERDGKILSMLWSATGKLYLHEAGTIIDTGANAFYRYNSFTHPEERQKGLYSGCSAVLSDSYRSEGRTSVYGAISVFNLPSLAASTKVGNKVVGESVLLSVFGIKFIRYKKWPHPVKRLTVIFGNPSSSARVI